MIERTLAHYEILDTLGEGAMGTVYRARDTKLGRDVALKVFPVNLAADPDRLDRFQREARVLAAIDHPNIVTIFSVEDYAGVHFLTMALVAGESLQEKLETGPVTLPAFYSIAGQLTDALGAAHERGIIHRDLKPANIMVTEDGRVKVLDFGLAKLTETDPYEAETDLKTKAGIVMGTAPYMSPEQVQGHALDHRSDLFSLGIVFYQMLTGERPFRGDNAAALFSAILRDEPAPITGAASELSRLVLRSVAKHPDERFQTAREVHDALNRLQSDPVPAGRDTEPSVKKTVVVLPFVNRSADPENEYFSTG
jgi:serine/threonine protein kinase